MPNGTITISSTDTARITWIVFNLSYQGQQQLAKLTSINGTVSQSSALPKLLGRVLPTV